MKNSPEAALEKIAGTAGARLAAVFATLDRATVAIAAAALIGLAAVEIWQVFARYVLNDSPSWSEPVALLLMSTAMMFGAAAGVRSNRHFGFFILVEAVNPFLRRLLLGFSRLLAAAIGVMLAGWSADMLVNAWDYPMAGAPLPQGMVFLPMCLGGALITLFALEQLVATGPREHQ